MGGIYVEGYNYRLTGLRLIIIMIDTREEYGNNENAPDKCRQYFSRIAIVE